MLTWPSRLLLALVSAVTGFAVTAVLLPVDTPVPLDGAPAVADGGADLATMVAVEVDGGPLAPGSPAVSAQVGTTPTPAAGAPGSSAAFVDGATEAPDAPDPSEAPRTVTIAFGGDVHGEPPIAGVLAAGDNPLEGVADLLSAADLAVVNLETAVGTTGTPADKTYTFQADPVLAERLADAGVDIVSLANNHALDYGLEGAAETGRILEEAGLAHIGYGLDAAAAYAPHVVEVGGRQIAFVGLSRVLPDIAWAATSDRAGLASAYDLDAATAAVRRAADAADQVVVMIHWGSERQTCPNGLQVQIAQALAAAGADAVIGHHPHVLQGVAEVGGAFVAYSLGNFVFYATRSEQRDTGVLTLELGVDGVEGYRWAPARIDGQGRPQPPEDAEEPPLRRAPVGTDGCGPPA